MTAAVHGPRVTQADRSKSAWLAVKLKILLTPDAMREGRMDDHPIVQAFARHREASQAELVEAAEKALALIDDMARFVGAMSLRDYANFNEAPIALRAALTKARTDATGEGA